MRQIFLADPDPGVSDNKAILMSAAVVICSFLFRDQIDAPAGGSIFNCIADNIDQDLLDPQLVRIHLKMPHAVMIVADLQVLAAGLQKRDIFDPPEYGPEVTDSHGQLHLAALDFGKVQNVIDQGQQEMTGRTDLLQCLRDHCRVVFSAFCDIGISDDCIHRGADIMGHVGKEIIPCTRPGLFHPLLILLLALHLGINVVGSDDQVPAVAVLEQSCLHTHPDRFPSDDQSVFHRKASVPRQVGQDFFLCENA